MTNEEEHTVIGRKYTEREDAQRELSDLDNKSMCIETVLREAADALKKRRDDGGNVMVAMEFPSRQQIMDILDRQATLLSRIREIDTFFASRGGPAEERKASSLTGRAVRG